MNTTEKALTITVHGYCSMSPNDVLDCVRNRRYAQLLQARGNFVIVASDATEVTILTSQTGVVPYYFCLVNGKLIHGPTVAKVFRDSGIRWEWNYQALADYLTLDHVIANSTLHPSIHRTEPASILIYSAGELRVERIRQEADTLCAVRDACQAVSAVTQEMGHWWANDSLLCLSGGLDSRLLLAALLSLGLRPDVLIVGQEGSFDRSIGTAIARRLRLSEHVAEICLRDMLDNAGCLAIATNGLLPFSHWPGVLITRHAAGGQVFLGYNGEFARSYFHDNGLLSLIYEALPATSRVRTYWSKRIAAPFQPHENAYVHSTLAAEFSPEGKRNRLDRLITSSGTFGERLDQVFLTQYGRNKIGANVAAVSSWTRWVTPFFSTEWIRAIRRLPRHWKLGSRFHRFAIHSLFPELMSFPGEVANHPTPSTSLNPPLLYWLGLSPLPVITHFVDQSIYDHPELINFMSDNLRYLSCLFDPTFLTALPRSHQRKRLLFQLGTLSIWFRSVVAASKEQAQGSSKTVRDGEPAQIMTT